MLKKLKTVLKDTLQQMRDGELQLVAASLSFSTAMALVPFIAVVLATFQSIGGLEALYPKVEALLLSNMKEAVGPGFIKGVKSILKRISAGKVGTAGAVFLFIASIRLLHDMEMGIHRVWNERNTRPFYRRLIYHWSLLLAIPLFLAVYVGFMTLEQFQFVHRMVPAFVSNSLVLVGTLFLIYKLVPHVQVGTRAALVSSLLASAALFAVHKGYVFLAKSFFSYNKLYGSLAVLPLLLLWILSLWYVVLGGVALCASLQRRRIA